eukprot:10008202-Alexandrium_andersonii.AAC.1
MSASLVGSEMCIRDSSDAARAIAHRMGPGRVRHVDLKTLFVQDYITVSYTHLTLPTICSV